MNTRHLGDRTALTAIAAGTALALLWTPAVVGRLARSERGPAEPQPPIADAAGIAFYASSLGSGWSFEGDYSGRLIWNGSGLEVDLPVAMIRQESAEGAATHVVGIALALAADTDSGWTLVRQGPLHLTRGATPAGMDTWMRNVRLRLDGISEQDLEGRWLVIVQQLEVEDATGSHTAWTYAHADRTLLPRLMDGVLDGC